MKREPADQEVRRRAAQSIDRNVFLDAGAGCGKTQALTGRVLALLEAGVEVAEIVAVTFTNKAARDMKARLRRECEQQALAAENAETAALWQRRARQLENAPISTIHAFCSGLLRRYALRAGLDPGFAVMDEVQHSLLLQDTLRRSLLNRLDADELSAAQVVATLGLQGGHQQARAVARGASGGTGSAADRGGTAGAVGGPAGRHHRATPQLAHQSPGLGQACRDFA
jgi:ATP-dependent helicase/nuclease subunit A